jgi:nucleotide-binding universal stress UspA family protein
MIDLHRILVPTDFGKSSANALTYGLAFAQKFGAEVWLLHVVQDLSLFIPEAVFVTPPPAPPVDQFIAAARAALERVVAGLHADGVSVHAEVGVGPP